MENVAINCGVETPVFTAEELGKMYYELNVMEKTGFTVLDFKGNYIAIPTKRYKELKGYYELSNNPCPFNNNGECSLMTDKGDFRPKSCKIGLDPYDKSVPIVNRMLNNKDIKNIRKFSKRDLKETGMRSVFYYLVYSMQVLEWDKITIPNVTKHHKYFMVKTYDKRVSAIREYQLQTETPLFSHIINNYSKLNRSLLYKDPDFISFLINNINKRLKGITQKELPREWIEKSKLSEEATETYISLITILTYILAIYDFDKKQLNAYIDVEPRVLRYLIKYLLDYVFTGEEKELKVGNEITLMDQLVTETPQKEVFDFMFKLSKNIIKALL